MAYAVSIFSAGAAGQLPTGSATVGIAALCVGLAIGGVGAVGAVEGALESLDGAAAVVEFAGVGHVLCALPIGQGAITTVTGGGGATGTAGALGQVAGVPGDATNGVTAGGGDAAGGGVVFVVGGVAVGGVVVTCGMNGIGYARSVGANSRLSRALEVGAW